MTKYVRSNVLAATSMMSHGVELDRSISALSSRRRTFELAHEAGHLTLGCNNSGMSSVIAALKLVLDVPLEGSLALFTEEGVSVSVVNPYAPFAHATGDPGIPVLCQRIGRVNRLAGTIRVLVHGDAPIANWWAASIGLIDNLLKVLCCIKGQCHLACV